MTAFAPSAALDVSGLPQAVKDHRSPIWWGNLLMLAIESTIFALLLASYFYIWQNFEEWPPPQVNRQPPLYNPVPDLGPATGLLVLLLLSIVPMLWASRACINMKVGQARAGLLVTTLAGVLAAYLEYRNLSSLHFKWSDNAYASIAWTLLGLHLLHTIVATGENTIMTTWIFAKGLDDKHARDVRVGAIYWYWVAGVWVVLYAVVFWAPRVI